MSIIQSSAHFASAQLPTAANQPVTAPNTISYPVRVADPAEKIQLLVVSLTNDPSRKIDLGTQANRDFIFALVNKELENAPERKGAQIRVDSAQFTSSSLAGTINQMSIGPKDTLICYVSTHGAFDPANGHYMVTGDGSVLFRSVLINQLQKKNARLTVLITDSCAVQQPAAASPQKAVVLTETHALFDLLFYYQGTVNINVSTGPRSAGDSGQFSWYWNQNDAKGGGFFTRAFCKSAIYGPAGTDWQSFVNDIQARIASEEQPPQPQVPMWFAN